jgi:hypothetical protein
MAGIRLGANDPMVDATLLRIAGRPLALHIDAELRRLQLQRDERRVVDLLRARRMTLAEILDAGVAQGASFAPIYALAITITSISASPRPRGRPPPRSPP